MGAIRRLLRPRPTNLEITTTPDLEAFLRAGSGTWSAVDVSVSKAQTMAGWFAGGRNIAEDIAKLPFILYEAGETRRRATSSPYWKLVHDRASSRWSSQQFREFMTFWAIQDGDAFALKVMGPPSDEPPVGRVVRELVPFRRGEVTVEEASNGDLVYHTRVAGKAETLTRRQVFHLQGFASRTAGGAELFKMSREDIGLALAMERHGATFFGNGANPGGALTHPAELSDRAYERLQASLAEGLSGANANTPLLLEEGMSWQQFSATNEQSQFIEGRKFQVTEAARRVRIAPHKVGDLERATFSNIEHQAIEYVQDSLLPWALRWENAFNLQVIGTDKVYAELLFDMLLRGDSTARSAVYSQALQNGWMTVNDVRRRENLPPIEGGDELYSMLNLATRRDRELDQLQTQTEIATSLVSAGYHPTDALRTAGLPAMRFVGQEARGA